MSDKMAEYLKNELVKKGQEIEEEVLANKEVSDAKAPDDMYEKIALRIANYEAQKAAYEHLSKEDQEALIRGRELMMLEKEEAKDDVLYEEVLKKLSEVEPRRATRARFRIPRKKKVFLAFAAILVLLFAMSMTSIGSKQYFMEFVNTMLGNGDIVKVNTKEEDRMYSENKEEVKAYETIEEELGIRVAELAYKPSGMVFDDFDIKPNIPWANIFYLYNDKYVITYKMGLTYRDASFGWRRGDRLIEEYEIDGTRNIINIKKYEVQKSKEIICVAEFHDNNTYYMLAGMIDENEFEKIVENIHFY